MSKKQLTGIIISDKMEKTLVVKVERIKEHPKYKRRYKIHKKYKAHNEGEEDKSSSSTLRSACVKGEYNIGDKVIIEEATPISRDKKWKVVKKA